MSLPSPIPPPLVTMIAARFRLLGEPTRVHILDYLREHDEASVGELAAALGTSQQNVSKHLSTLHSGGIVGKRRDGNRVIYSIADETVVAICEAVCGSIERQTAELSAAFAEVSS